MDETHSRSRAQTAQDFAVGIGIFLLVIAFVFAFLPTVFSPFDTDVGAAQQSQADRTATFISHNITESGEPNHVNTTQAETFFSENDGSVDTIQNTTGVSFDARINVTISPLDEDDPVEIGGERAVAGPTYNQGQPAVSASRILVIDEVDECDPGCELEVRVW